MEASPIAAWLWELKVSAVVVTAWSIKVGVFWEWTAATELYPSPSRLSGGIGRSLEGALCSPSYRRCWLKMDP